MFRPLKRSLEKFRKRAKDDVNTVEDHAQTPESPSGLKPETVNSSETGVVNSHEATPANSEPKTLQQRSGDSDESRIDNSQEEANTMSAADETYDPIPAYAEHGSSSAEGAAPSLSESIRPEKEHSMDTKPRRNLWKEAHEALSQDNQDLLSKIETVEGSKVVEQVVEQVQQKYPEHGKGPWKKAFESTLKSVLVFKDVINSAVSCDPTGHAASAWTVVSLGLQMAQNEVDRRHNVLKTCGLLAGALKLTAAFEDSYRVRRVQHSDSLEDNIVKVYAAILEFSAEVVHQNAIGQRILCAFIKLADQPLQESAKALKEAQEELNPWADIVKQEDHIGLMDDVDCILAEMEEMAGQVSEPFDMILTQEENKILDWLSAYPFDSYRATEEQRESGTGEWILKSCNYKEWKRSDKKLIWLYGNSGCGKSFLCSRIIDDLKSLSDSEASHVLAYWFFTDNNRDSLDIDNMLYCITRQLCGGAKNIPESVRDLWNQNSGAGTRPAGSLVENMLDSVVSGLQRTGLEILIVLDGLDEYPVKDRQGSLGARRVPGRKAVLKWLRNFGKKHENARVLVASRKEIDIQENLGHIMTLDVAKEITEDVDLFIESCIERITGEDENWKSSFKTAMIEKMKGASEKRFRWVYLVEQRFLSCNNPEILRKALKTLPEEVVGIYAQVLKDIPEDDKETARLILICLTYSVRPLTLEELASAVSMPNPLKVLDICTSSLISLQPEGLDVSNKQVVKFDHFSVKEYLNSEKFRTSPETAFFYVSPLIAHLTIAQISISRFIDINNFNLATRKSTEGKLAETFDVESWLPGEDPLLGYSTIWYKHIQEADAIERSKAPSAEIQHNSSALRIQCHKLFYEEFSQSFRNWRYLLWEKTILFEGIPQLLCGRAATPIIMATLAGSSNNVRRLLDDGGGNVRSLNKTHKSAFPPIKIARPIHAAAISGKLEILRLLLAKGATLDQSELDMIAGENIRQGADVLNDILEFRPSLKITDDTMMASAKNLISNEMLSYILDHENGLTQSQLAGIARNYSTIGQVHDVIEKIISYGERIGCDRNVILIAFVGSRRGEVVVPILLDQYRPSNSMASSILQSVLKKRYGSLRNLEYVLRYYRDACVDIKCTLDIINKSHSFRHSFDRLNTILNHAKTVVVGINTLQSVAQSSKGMILMNLLMNHEKCEVARSMRTMTYFVFDFKRHLSACSVIVTKETTQLAAQLDETALATLRKNARSNVVFSSADVMRNLVEQHRNGTQQQIESNLVQISSSEPETAPQSEASEQGMSCDGHFQRVSSDISAQAQSFLPYFRFPLRSLKKHGIGIHPHHVSTCRQNFDINKLLVIGIFRGFLYLSLIVFIFAPPCF